MVLVWAVFASGCSLVTGILIGSVIEYRRTLSERIACKAVIMTLADLGLINPDMVPGN